MTPAENDPQTRLEESEQRYRSLYEQNLDAVYDFDLQGRFVDANPACEALSGHPMDELRGTPFLDLIVPEDRARAQAAFAEAVRGRPQQDEIAIWHKSGRRVELHIAKIPIVVGGQVVGVFGIAEDITERKRMQEALRESEERLRTIAETSPVAMTITRWQEGTVLYANRHVRDLFGMEADADVTCFHAAEFYVRPADRQALLQALIAEGFVQNHETEFRRLDGTSFWGSGSYQRMEFHGEPVIFAAYHDVSERKAMLEQAQDEAEHDPLTGLLNHRAFHKRYEEEAQRALEDKLSLAVAVLDLDNFKFFNDSYGHAIGDDVLRQVGEALRGACRTHDTLARFGGDEFALLLPDAGAEITADEIAARLNAALRDVSYRPPGYGSAIPVSLSVGVALFPADAPNRSAVMQLADERLRRAKTGGLTEGEAHQVRAAMQDVSGFSMLDALVNAVDNKDRYTRRHSEDVMAYSLLIARALGLDGATQQTIAVAALLHDVGKIGVPDAILRKPGALTPEEFAAIQQHPVMGYVIVGAVPGLEDTLDAVRHHHERWDGTGYPDRLRGQQTPLLARLMAVADAYSAMTSDRPYRKGKSAAQALSVLKAGAGTQWDPACVAAFHQAMQGKRT